MILTDNPIEFALLGQKIFVPPNKIGMQITPKITQTLRYSTCNPTQVKIRYDGTMYPLYKLIKINPTSSDDFNLHFTIKTHSRNLTGYPAFIKFRIPKIYVYCSNLFCSTPRILFILHHWPLYKYFKKLDFATAFFEKGEIMWPYGNVYETGYVCWGEIKEQNVVPSLYKWICSMGTKVDVMYLDWLMHDIYCSFFETILNTDLRFINLFYLLDFKDEKTRKAVDAKLKEEGFNITFIELLKSRKYNIRKFPIHILEEPDDGGGN